MPQKPGPPPNPPPTHTNRGPRGGDNHVCRIPTHPRALGQRAVLVSQPHRPDLFSGVGGGGNHPQGGGGGGGETGGGPRQSLCPRGGGSPSPTFRAPWQLIPAGAGAGGGWGGGGVWVGNAHPPPPGGGGVGGAHPELRGEESPPRRPAVADGCWADGAARGPGWSFWFFFFPPQPPPRIRVAPVIGRRSLWPGRTRGAPTWLYRRPHGVPPGRG